jgi:hypothetical protein
MLKPCKHCIKSKAKQKNICKESVAQKTNVPGHMLYIELLKVGVKSRISKNVTINHDNWKVIVCKVTGKKWSDFTVTKSGMVKRTCDHLHKLKTCGIPVQYVLLDPAGERRES